jgi:hypothetical protein
MVQIPGWMNVRLGRKFFASCELGKKLLLSKAVNTRKVIKEHTIIGGNSRINLFFQKEAIPLVFSRV